MSWRNVVNGGLGGILTVAIVNSLAPILGDMGATITVLIIGFIIMYYATAVVVAVTNFRLFILSRRGTQVRGTDGGVTTTSIMRSRYLSEGLDGVRMESDRFILAVDPATHIGMLMEKHFAFHRAWRVDMREYETLVLIAMSGYPWMIPNSMIPPADFKWASIHTRDMGLLNSSQAQKYAVEPLYVEIAQNTRVYVCAVAQCMIGRDLAIIVGEYISELDMLHIACERI